MHRTISHIGWGRLGRRSLKWAYKGGIHPSRVLPYSIYLHQNGTKTKTLVRTLPTTIIKLDDFMLNVPILL